MTAFRLEVAGSRAGLRREGAGSPSLVPRIELAAQVDHVDERGQRQDLGVARV